MTEREEVFKALAKEIEDKHKPYFDKVRKDLDKEDFNIFQTFAIYEQGLDIYLSNQFLPTDIFEELQNALRLAYQQNP